MVALAAMVIPLVAFGFADYFTYFYSGLDSTVVSITLIALFIVINYLGMEVASGFQNLMVIGFILALLIFGIGGLTHADPALMKPLIPRGWSPIVVAATTAYFSYAGVFIIAEVAGEIKNPGRTIPLAIFLSFAVIILLYTLVPLALTSVLNWETMGSTRMAVVTASQKFMPAWLVTVIAAGALFAAATSVNGIMMGLSRDFYKGAKSGLFPRYFAAIHPRSKDTGAGRPGDRRTVTGRRFGGWQHRSVRADCGVGIDGHTDHDRHCPAEIAGQVAGSLRGFAIQAGHIFTSFCLYLLYCVFCHFSRCLGYGTTRCYRFRS